MMQRDDLIVRNAYESEAALLHEYDSRIFSDSWSEKSYLGSICSSTELVPAAVDRETGEIAAFAAVSYVFDEANINRIAVRPEFRGKKTGTFLLEWIEENLPDEVTVINLEVRESNKYAIEMYENFGYTVLGRRKRFYRNPEEDALLMTKRKVDK
ncbi:MAG: ribosomal protein S18-alanine N-acetyltransferase [Oscillospiraceae bacterium]|nr:ribosomal protein S18-alanine N-acetyltransferase [Oscillospiraceae bacterium]